MEYRVTLSYSDVWYVNARSEKEAISKAKKKAGEAEIYAEVETRKRCAGTWKRGCTNLCDWPIGRGYDECSDCRWDREQDRINSPG